MIYYDVWLRPSKWFSMFVYVRNFCCLRREVVVVRSEGEGKRELVVAVWRTEEEGVGNGGSDVEE